MKYLITFFLLFGVAYGQNWIPMSSNYKYKGIKADSILSIPRFNDTTSPQKANGYVILVDTTFYIYNNKWIAIGGGGSQATLQTVTDNGNTTTNDIIFTYDNDIYLDTFSSIILSNNSRLQEGYIDAGYGGNHGIALVCGLGYEYKWEGGRLFVMNNSGNAIREARYMFTDVPNNTHDYTKGYYVGSRWILDNGDTYECSDNSLNAAVWNLLPTAFDSTSLSNRIDLKLNITDTSNKWVNSIYRKAGKDSIFYKIGATEYSIKDSIGGVGHSGRFGNDTATVVLAKVHNDAGSQLTNGEVVYLAKSGTSSDAPSVKRAYNKADSVSANTFGFVIGTIANNDTGYVVLSGKIEKLNTAAFSNGDIIYLDSIAGKWTKSKPKAPYHLVYLGVVVKANAGNGSIFVKPQNGYELDEIHDVQINSALNNQVIVYSDTQKLWKNRNIYSIVDTTSLSNRINNIDLQSVTDNGDTTNHSLYIQSLKLYDGVNNGYGSIDNTDGIYTFKDYNGNNRLIFEEGLLTLYNSTNPININSSSTTASRTYYLPDTSGVFTMRSDSTLFQTKFRTDTMRNNIYSALNGKQSTLTFSTGLTNIAGTITSNLSTGVSGGQSIIGGTAASNSLTLSSTSNATKGKLLFGTSAYDEANNRLGIGTASPSNTLQVEYLPTSNTQNVVVFKNTSTTLANSYNNLALDCANSAADQAVDIRLGSTNPKGLRIYASNVDLTGSPAGAGFQMYSTSSTNFPGQVYFDGGAHNSSSLIFRTAATGGTITQRLRIFANGNVSVSSSGTDPGVAFNVNGTSQATQFKLSALNNAPATASSTGTTGEIRIVNGFIYVCVATNTWQRAALSTW